LQDAGTSTSDIDATLMHVCAAREDGNLVCSTQAIKARSHVVQAVLRTTDSTISEDAEQLTFLSGNKYQGHRRGLVMNGQGLYLWRDEQAIFKGEFNSNMPTGHGQYVWNDGSSFTGGIVQGQREGVGVFAAADIKVLNALSRDTAPCAPVDLAAWRRWRSSVL
jgi:hypothetical protein